jgi:GAF domain-containing protein/anti-sigma regulatory factor (Ser/Thr protein kinase)
VSGGSSGSLDPEALEVALRELDEGFASLDRDLRFRWVNDLAARLLRRPADVLVGRLLFELFPEGRETVAWSALHEALATGQVRAFQLWYGPLEGWFRVRAVPVPGGLALWLRNVDDEQAAATAHEQLVERQERADERADRLLQVTAALSSAHTLPAVIDVVIDKGFSLLGGYGGGVGLVREARGELEIVDLRHLGGDIRERWVGVFPLDTDLPMMISAREGEPLFYETIQALRDRHPDHTRDFGARTRAFVSLPLWLAQRTIGALVVMFDEAREFSEDDRNFMMTLAGLCAQALERARLNAREGEIARTLQRSLLPVLDVPPQVEVAVRYLPGGAGSEVGGDWYDVLGLGAGRVAVAVGDVMGRGVAAAALMGQVRAAMRAYALLDLAPSLLLDRLDLVVRDVAEGAFVTCIYALYDPADRTLTFSSAGHPPPLVASAGGASAVQLEPGPPLGLGLGGRNEQVVVVEPTDVVALYTDGLVETRERDVDEGVRVLADVLARPPADLESLGTRAVAALVAPEHDDDVALLLLRPLGDAIGVAAPWVTLPRDPAAVADARALTWRTLAARGAAPRLGEAVTLVVSELVTNAIRHGRGDPRLRVRVASPHVVIEVEDEGGHLPQRRFATADDEGGRGLELVALVAGRWGWRPTASGKVVWAELPTR